MSQVAERSTQLIIIEGGAEVGEPGRAGRPTVGCMVSAWLFVALAALAALACGIGAYRLARRPRGTRSPRR